MRILLSAYALGPGRGSEPGLGWLWASTLAAKGHEVTVLTSGTRHRAEIERYREQHQIPFAIEYVDVPWLGGHRVFAQHFHYLFWLVAAGRRSVALRGRGHRFDFTHQITWASLRYPCFLAHNGVLVLGPMGGAELSNRRLRGLLSPKDRVSEFARWATIALPAATGLSGLWLRRADAIALASKDNLWAIPKHLRSKVLLGPAIGLQDFPLAEKPRGLCGNPVRLIFAGRLVGWKGVGIAVEVISELVRRGVDVSLTVLGQGDTQTLERQFATSPAWTHIRWVSWMDRSKVPFVFDQHDILLFPSMHDSGAMVVLEAMARGLPVIALDVGGPGFFVTAGSGVLVPNDLSMAETISELASAVERAAIDANYPLLSQGAIARAREWLSEELVSRTYSAIRTHLGQAITSE